MANQIDTLGRVATKLTQDIQRLQMIVMGDHEVIKRLGEFPEIIKQMEDEQRQASEPNSAAGGDQKSFETGESVGTTSDQSD